MNKNNYHQLKEELTSLLNEQDSWLANLANAAAFLYHKLEKINWLGFYLYEQSEQYLMVGPFQGLPACSRIKVGSGVCGTAVKEKRTIRVGDVEKFPGHIVCDPRSRSEIVIPLLEGDKVFGVLDIDSSRLNRFSSTDQQQLEQLVALITETINLAEIAW